MAKATHNGTCQVCGRNQAIKNGVLAHHGYTVEYSYFHGTCQGSREKPLQVSKGLAITTIKSCIDLAKKLGAKTIEDIKSVTVTTRERVKYNGYAHTEKTEHEVNNEAEYNELNERSTSKGCYYPFDVAKSIKLKRIHQSGLGYAEHAAGLKQLIKDVHGTDLIPR
jgi:hypothetical protein